MNERRWRTTLAFLGVVACSSSDGPAATSTHDAGTADAGTSVTSSDAASNDGATPPPTSAPPVAGCLPLRHYTFTSTGAVPLGCDANAPATIIDEALPVNGRAVGRATFTVHHLGTNSVTHFWNLRVPLGTPIDAYGLGDDVCPGTSSARSNLGFGTVSAEANRAKLVGHEGAAPCTPGTLEVEAGATLEVWLEDDAPDCAGKDIAFTSYYDVNGVTTPYAWKTTFEQLPGVTAKLTTDAPSTQLRVLGVVEGSPTKDPNTACGSEVATIDLETQLDGQTMAFDKQVVPASQGMGHRVLFTSTDVNEIRAVAPGTHTASLLVATDFIVDGFPVTVGGCCGDGEVALLRLR